MSMEPTAALQSIEAVLRLAIRTIIPADAWLDVPGVPDREHLQSRQEEEGKKRDGAVVSSDLLDYVETHHLTKIIEKEWVRFLPIFEDAKRTKVFFKIVLDVRNTVAHSRHLLPFERDLLAGVAGQLSNQFSIFRSTVDASSAYYPTIEEVSDSFGQIGADHYARDEPPLRLDVGEIVRIRGRAVSPRGHDVNWFMSREQLGTLTAKVWPIGKGLNLDYEWTVTESEVGENRQYAIFIVSDSKYHRHDMETGLTTSAFDDSTSFMFSINPPID